MAIVVEEEKKGGFGILNLLTWLAVIAAVGGSVYYVFFAQPEILGNINAPTNFQSTEELSKITLNPQDILENPAFQNLRPYITPLEPFAAGRQNPFLGF